MKRTAFFISDGTGITAETLGNSLLAQFDGIQFERITLPYIDSLEKAHAVVEQINDAIEKDQERPIILDTIVNLEIREYIAKCKGMMIDVFSTFLNPLEKELGVRSSYSVGKSHAIVEMNRYKSRIDAVNFALDNDDGARIQQYDKAEIILVGVSRSGKTPSCLYMALQYGIRAANYPLTEEDMANPGLPECLLAHRSKLYGLTIDPFQLAAIRHERRPNSRYASLDQCSFEVRTIERLFRDESLPFINTTTFSVEEIATRIISERKLNRRQ
ncbi:putative phosphoenolpyruvate synthase regulatory protein [Marinobacterium nitratireducens]|uniref:Putative phosphoenolpyruvate synthase regulatory protein n=1 Tax=Marinobacterium nitratireducens TaxID=518897 RepID=A0A918DWD7_9GAMM|nr:pyruvate, water dikinase regulatory protein [Marinobacterium nitratireducens]GGO85486.1 putative phosphoenolpyruvate synthase regulatory protein [Marinobacterium nitratireducens]